MYIQKKKKEVNRENILTVTCLLKGEVTGRENHQFASHS